MQAVNWAGFYVVRPYAVQGGGENAKGGDDAKQQEQLALILGPFHGKPAVTVIAHGKGVCGETWRANTTQLVPDVHLHPNHIACDR